MLSAHPPEMTARDVLQLMTLFEQAHIEVILDGGWGVDALLGEQTRTHADLDIVLLYQDVPRPDTRPVNFVMGDAHGRQVDIHTYTLDRENHPEQGLDYPLESLRGTGSILGHAVRCIDARNMVQFHTGYTLDQDDYLDVKALCRRFGLPLPPEYARFER